MWKSEGLFAEAKQNHNLSRAKYRGRPKVQIQALLSAIAQNVKRSSRYFIAGSSVTGYACKPNQRIDSRNEHAHRLFQHAPSLFWD